MALGRSWLARKARRRASTHRARVAGRLARVALLLMGRVGGVGPAIGQPALARRGLARVLLGVLVAGALLAGILGWERLALFRHVAGLPASLLGSAELPD